MPPGARRPPAVATRLAGLLLGALVLTSCGSAGQPAPYDATGVDGLEIPTPSPDPADFVGTVDNPWFPLPPTGTRRYLVEDAGRRTGTVLVEVAGQERLAGLTATVVVTTARVEGEQPSTVTRWYAQDESGNVWLLGEDTAAGEWRAGEGGAEAGLVMPAEPRVGDGWVKARVPGATEETVLVTEPGTIERGATQAVTVRTTEVDRSGTRTENEYVAGLGLVESVAADSGRTTTLVGPPP